jgi:PPM family protein phosphatase
MENNNEQIPNTQDKEVTKLSIGIAQDIGKRKEQQDSYGYNFGDESKGSLFIVADGMGGMEYGSTASAFATGFTSEVFGKQDSIPDIPDFLTKMMYSLNQKVVTFSQEKNLAGGVGTTVVSVVIVDNHLYWVSIGDSRIYLFKENYLLQLTYDHVYENQLKKKVENSEISLTDALKSHEKGYLTSYIGIGHLKEVDYNVKPLALEKGDKIVLCSDGIYNALSEVEFVQHLNKPPQQSCDDIVDVIAAKEYRSQDNMTITIIEYKGEQ